MQHLHRKKHSNKAYIRTNATKFPGLRDPSYEIEWEENERLILNPNYQSYETYEYEKELNNKILSKVEKILDLVPNRRLVNYFNKRMKIKKNFVTGKISGVKEWIARNVIRI